MADLTTVLDGIDAAIAPACTRCSRALGESPSDDFCSERCQTEWHRHRSFSWAEYRAALERRLVECTTPLVVELSASLVRFAESLRAASLTVEEISAALAGNLGTTDGSPTLDS